MPSRPQTSTFDAFARYRRIWTLTYSSSVQMLRTEHERLADSHAECVLG